MFNRFDRTGNRTGTNRFSKQDSKLGKHIIRYELSETNIYMGHFSVFTRVFSPQLNSYGILTSRILTSRYLDQSLTSWYCFCHLLCDRSCYRQQEQGVLVLSSLLGIGVLVLSLVALTRLTSVCSRPEYVETSNWAATHGRMI